MHGPALGADSTLQLRSTEYFGHWRCWKENVRCRYSHSPAQAWESSLREVTCLAIFMKCYLSSSWSHSQVNSLILPAQNEIEGHISAGDSCSVPHWVMQGTAAKKQYLYSNFSPQRQSSGTITKPSSIWPKPAFHFCRLLGWNGGCRWSFYYVTISVSPQMLNTYFLISEVVQRYSLLW